MCKLVTIKNNIGKDITVADIKVDIIHKIIDYASKCKYIDYIILFGSSVEDRCKEASDIDIAIISNTTRSKLFKSSTYDKFISDLYKINITQEYDILQFNSMNDIIQRKDNICSEIQRKGQTIYQRRGIKNVQ